MANQVKSSDQALRDEVAGIHWSGAASEQFRATAGTRSQDFRKCVEALDAAAEAISRLAGMVG